MSGYRIFGGAIKNKIQISGKTDRPQHSQIVFIETNGGIANGANDFLLHIGAAANIIEDFTRPGIHQQAVNRKITSEDIFADGRKVNL